MDMDTLLAEWEKDSEIDGLNPGLESIRTGKLHAKYLKIYSKHTILVKKYKNDFAQAKRIKWQYYNGHFNTDKEMLEKLGLEPFKLILKQDIPVYMESDPELLDITNKLTYHEQIVNICERVLNALKNRGFEVKNHIDFLKFEAGA